MLCVVLGALLLASASALAATQRNHVFSFAFGSLGKGSGQFFHPSGVAVDDATGEVYVADRENGRLEAFEPVQKEGQLVEETPVSSFHAEVPYPEQIAVDNCTEPGTTNPCPSTTDPSVGDVYVIGATKDEVNNGEIDGIEPKDPLLYKFSPAGVLLGKPLKLKSEGLEGVAVDSSGNVFVYQRFGKITQLSDGATNVVESSIQAGAKQPEAHGLAVDHGGEHLYIGALASEDEAHLGESVAGLLFELEQEHVPLIAELEGSTGNVLVHEFDYEASTAVAVNPLDVPGNGTDELDDVYVDNAARADNEQVTTVAAFSPNETAGPSGEGEGELIQRFGAPDLKEADGIAVDADTGAVLVSDGVSNRIDVFELEPPGSPSIESLSATSAEGGETTLLASISAAGAKTEYTFEYGSASCGTVPSPCVSTPPAELGESFGGQTAQAQLQGLEPGVYHYRVRATNRFGKVHSAEQTFTVIASLGTLPDGRGWEMVSPPDKDGAEPEPIRKEGGLVQASANGDAITYTADGPIPAGVEPEGNRVPEVAQILSTRNRASGGEAWASQDIATPNETGAGPTAGEAQEYEMFSPDLALALVAPYPAASGPFAAPPLSPLAEGEVKGKQETTVYLRDNGPEDVLAPEASEAQDYEQARENGEKMDPHNPGYVPLVTKANEPGPGFGRELLDRGVRAQAATPNLSHVLYRSENEAADPGLYEWSEGKSQLVSVLEDGEALHLGPSVTYFGGAVASFKEPNDVDHAISSNGSRVFWTYVTSVPQATHLEVRQTAETEAPETLQLDTVQGGTGAGAENAVYQTASADGSKVFFTDEQRLTAGSGAQKHRPDLYVAELKIVGGHLLSHLTDLTALQQEGAEVLTLEERSGGVIGASEDGSYVYFVADAALTPNASRGHCAFGNSGERRPPGTTCNLYVRHYDEASGSWEPTQLVAALSFEDSPDWGGFTGGPLAYRTSRVSPNGRYLAFMSDRSLTGYDNEDASGNRHQDEEVYLYDAQQASLVCASCNPSGARPRGVYDAGLTSGGKGEGLGLVVDRAEIWSENTANGGEEGTTKPDDGIDNWLAGSVPGWTNAGGEYATYQSRYLSDSGRLFFNSADALVPLATPTRKQTVEGKELSVGVENVYEYEPNATGNCDRAGGCIGLISSGRSEHESAFLDASESGNDVFFLTAEKLVPQDTDGNFDVYDAHVCEAAAPCPAQQAAPTPPCEGETCQGAVSVPATPAASGTQTFSGSGNLLVPQQGVLPEKASTPPSKKPLTRAQKLARALKVCRKDKQRSKRVACEKTAHKKYGPVKKSTAKKSANTEVGR